MTDKQERRLLVVQRRLEEAAVAKDRVSHEPLAVRTRAEADLKKARTWFREVVRAMADGREPLQYGDRSLEGAA